MTISYMPIENCPKCGQILDYFNTFSTHGKECRSCKWKEEIDDFKGKTKMDVYIVVKIIFQDEYTNDYECASPASQILNVYSNREKAKAEWERLRQEDLRLVKETHCDPTRFEIERREVL